MDIKDIDNGLQPIDVKRYNEAQRNARTIRALQDATILVNSLPANKSVRINELLEILYRAILKQLGRVS